MRTPIDIANRACQHMGVRKIDPTVGFNEDSVQASEIGSCYNELRQAELRRNLWRFSTRQTILRPVGVNTVQIDPPLWSSTTTYFPGAIVTTIDGALWSSNSANNRGNAPGLSSLWEGYFGPMTCDAWDSTLAYYAGELVYVQSKNGIPKLYRSLVNGNEATPGSAPAWTTVNPVTNGQQYYFTNDVVIYSGSLYQSLIDLNGNNTPGLAPAIWASGTTYAAGSQATGTDSVVYTSNAAGNIGHNPVTTTGYWTAAGLSNPASWVIGTTYALGAQVAGSDGLLYRSLQASNTGHDPVSNPTWWETTGAKAPWTATITNTAGAVNWAPVGVAFERLLLDYPIGCGPYQESTSRNVYRLPAGFLRQAPLDPKQGQSSILGFPTNLLADDWVLSGNYFVSSFKDPINMRFVADLRDASQMDNLFAEGLAARIGMECCVRVTGSDGKMQICAIAYKSSMGEARLVNSIENGPVEPPLDDYIACRF